jgi:hypothetical protein
MPPFEGWARTPPKDRATLLLKLADRIEADGPGFAKVESQNCGKPYAAALADEIPAIADVFRFFAGACRNLTSAVSGEYLAGYTSMIRRDPVGVVASIAPWNYPLMMAAWKLGPALAAGNTCVLKPSEQTPLTALKLGELLGELFPAGVVNVISGRGASVGAPLTRHPKVRMISLTGDVATGAKILEAASDGIKRTHLELGGKAPVIVFDDADLESVVSGVRTFGYYNSGQDCTAGVPALRRREGLRHARGGSHLGRGLDQRRRSDRKERRNGPAHQRRAAHSCSRLRRTREEAEAHRESRPAARGAVAVFLRAHGRRRRAADGRDRAARSVSGRSCRSRASRIRTGDRVGQRLRYGSPRRSGRRTSARR